MSQLKITVSGPAGSGKTTLAHTIRSLLCEHLPGRLTGEGPGFTIKLDTSVERPHDLNRSLAGLAARGTEIVIIERPESRKMAALTPNEHAELEEHRRVKFVGAQVSYTVDELRDAANKGPNLIEQRRAAEDAAIAELFGELDPYRTREE